MHIQYLKLKSLINKDITILAVDVANKSTMSFKNGSVIKTVSTTGNVIRGKRSELPIHYDDFEYNKEDLDEILKPYLKN